MLENVERALNASLSELTDCAHFVDLSESLRPRLRQMLAWDTLPPDSKQLATRYMNSGRVPVKLVYNSLYVVAHATFEHFTRYLVEEVVQGIDAHAGSFETLDESLVKNHMAWAGQLLATIHQPLDYYNINYYELCRIIGTSYPGSEKVRLNPSVFSFNAGSMTVGNLEQLFGRVRININWDQFGRDRSLGQLMESTSTRETSKKVKEFLEAMVRLRNRIAHTGATISEVDLPILERQCSFIKSFFRILVSISRQT